MYGNGRPYAMPVLYPQGLTHQMGITLDGKAGQGLPVDMRQPPPKTPFIRQSQYQYLPYARNQRDFAKPVPANVEHYH
jgi:hypothetical protein